MEYCDQVKRFVLLIPKKNNNKPVINTTKVNKDDDLARLVLKKYINDYDTLELLKVFFMNNMNVLKSAKLLYIHRNTLINKLARFKEDTSFDPKEFRDAYIVYSLIK